MSKVEVDWGTASCLLKKFVGKDLALDPNAPVLEVPAMGLRVELRKAEIEGDATWDGLSFRRVKVDVLESGIRIGFSVANAEAAE